MALFLELEPGDAVRIGPGTTLQLVAKSGKRTRLRIESTEDVQQIRAGEAAPESAPPAMQRRPAAEPAEPAAPAPAAQPEGKVSMFRRPPPAR